MDYLAKLFGNSKSHYPIRDRRRSERTLNVHTFEKKNKNKSGDQVRIREHERSLIWITTALCSVHNSYQTVHDDGMAVRAVYDLSTIKTIWSADVGGLQRIVVALRLRSVGGGAASYM
uniref:Uncharacterized protein n=1 Tax=Sipha flava TaxID=143950 RepID=A0A2S2QKJ9_9HEMI